MSLVCLQITLLLLCGLSFATPQKGTQQRQQRPSPKPPVRLFAIKMPSGPYPEEAVKKHVEGTVVLTIVVNAQGRVSEAKVKSGPPELIQAALDSTTLWGFVPPNPAPFTDTVSVSYGFPKECPGSEADAGSVEMRSSLRSEKGNVIGMDEDLDRHLPTYFKSDWRAGVAGRMMLSITVDASGNVTQVSVVKPLSPDLDRTTAETVRAWKFKLLSGNPQSFPDVFLLPIQFRPTCSFHEDP
jgi:TonB family protein